MASWFRAEYRRYNRGVAGQRLTPKDDEFNWVRARQDCCEENEFAWLRDLVRRNCEARASALSFDSNFNILFGENDARSFKVTRTNPLGHPLVVSFSLEDTVIKIDTPSRTLTVTVRLNKKAQCRFSIDGNGELLRWQVAQEVLQPLFFDTPPE